MLKTFALLLGTLASTAIFAEDASDWRTPSDDNLVYLELETGTAVIELAPFAAPEHTKRFKNLVKSGFYDGLSFYRVIEGFVAQGGDDSEQKPSDYRQPLKAEFTVSPIPTEFSAVESRDFKAPKTGYLHGFSAGADPVTNESWLLHCPGLVAMARGNEKHSATTDFYVVIGQAPRHLDRNMSSFGRVIYGMSSIQALNRASANSPSGVIDEEDKRSRILSAKLANDVAPEQRVSLQVQSQHSNAVKERLEGARTLDNPFFHYKANRQLDLCYHQLKTRVL